MPKLTREEIDARITYHPPTDRAKVLHDSVRQTIGDAMEKFSNQLPDTRETSLVITKLEEAMYWANASIARNHDRI